MFLLNKYYKCPFCDNKYLEKNYLYRHMELKHKEQLNNLPASQVYFNNKYNKKYGKCIICGKPTDWNLITEKYERLCHNPECKKKYVNMFRERMLKKYNKTTLLNDPDVQKNMLANRKISGEYIWSDGKTKTKYTGSYEKDFLEFMDTFVHYPPNDLIMPAPQIFYYKYNGKSHFYIPDAYLTSINTIIEIKSFDNKHYRERDINIEKIKDNVVKKSIYNYIKIGNKDYEDFFNYLLNFNK